MLVRLPSRRFLRTGWLREVGALAHKMLREADKRAASPGFLRVFGHNGSGCNKGRRKRWLRSCSRTTQWQRKPPKGRGFEGLGKDFGLGRHSLHRSEEHTSELQSLMRISYAVFCLIKNKKTNYPLSLV